MKSNDVWHVNHINEDKNDYRPTNLEFIQGKENRGKWKDNNSQKRSIEAANNVISIQAAE